jgi:hypothetical protein
MIRRTSSATRGSAQKTGDFCGVASVAGAVVSAVIAKYETPIDGGTKASPTEDIPLT